MKERVNVGPGDRVQHSAGLGFSAQYHQKLKQIEN